MYDDGEVSVQCVQRVSPTSYLLPEQVQTANARPDPLMANNKNKTQDTSVGECPRRRPLHSSRSS